MARLHGRSTCRLWSFDPTVHGFPQNSSLNSPGQAYFSAVGLRPKVPADLAEYPWYGS
jgi:hypothetical protein